MFGTSRRIPALLWLAVFLMMLTCFHLPQVEAQSITKGLTLFGGGRVTHAINGENDGQGVFGLSTRLTGPLHLFTYATIDPRMIASGATVDSSGSLSVEGAALFRFTDSSRFTVGVLLGPNLDFKGTEDPIAYLTGAAGFVGSAKLTGVLFKWTKPWGAWSYFKYKFNHETNGFRQGWEFGAGLFFQT